MRGACHGCGIAVYELGSITLASGRGRSFPQSPGAERGRLALERRSDPVFARVTEAPMQKQRMNLLAPDEVWAGIAAETLGECVLRSASPVRERVYRPDAVDPEHWCWRVDSDNGQPYSTANLVGEWLANSSLGAR